jgi:hypothetical protein
MSPRGKLAYEIRSLLKNFEARIANPSDLEMLGTSYQSILDWARGHDLEYLDWACRYPANPVVLEVFDLLEHDAMYPAWRRQALDEAYMLLYEDLAKQGDPMAIESLPEPHIPQETGYRTLPSPLVRASNDLRKGMPPLTVRHGHEHTTSQCYCASKRFDYEIRMGPAVFYDSARQKNVCGREIVSRGASERQCCLDPVTALVQAVLPKGCGGRDGADWSALLGFGPSQQVPSIPEDAPVWPEPPAGASDPFLQKPLEVLEPTPGVGASLSTLPRARRDELMQPSVGKHWWA